MMAMTITEKILAAHAGMDHVEPGQLVNVKVDLGLGKHLLISYNYLERGKRNMS